MERNYIAGVIELGSGYDIFGKHASEESLKSSLFDWSKINDTSVDDSINTGIRGSNKSNVIPEAIIAHSVTTATQKTYQGYSLSEYHKQLSASAKIAGAEGLFSGSIKSSFSKSIASSSSYAFFSTENIIGFWRLQLSNDLKVLRAALKDNIKSALDGASNSSDYKKIFDQYGSHVLANLIVGGKAVIHKTTERRTLENKLSFNAEVNASYGVINGSASFDDSTTSSKHSGNSTYKASALGGSSVEASVAFKAGGNFDKWRNSLKDNPVFVDFSDESPLLGIWNLMDISKSSERLDMMNYFKNEWLPQKENENKFPNSFVTDVEIKAFNHEYNQSNEASFELDSFNIIDQDLSEGAGGKYIYTFQQTDINSKTVITDLEVRRGKNATAREGFTIIDQDLNENSGGDYLYLCKKVENRAKLKPGDIIKDITVIKGDSHHVPLPYGYQYVELVDKILNIAESPIDFKDKDCGPADLNNGAGGKFIYICYRK